MQRNTGSFGALDPRVAEAAARRGIQEPTEIQRLAFPVLATTHDALLLSPTGTGKTEAALLPLLSQLLTFRPPPTSLLYITPLRALNRDLELRLVALAKEVGLTAAVRHGDTPSAQRLALSKRPPDLLLTTPETLQILLVGPRLRQALRHVRTVVVDELHELVPSDRGAQLAVSLERLDAFIQKPIRRLGLSATVSNPESVARFLAPPPRTAEVVSAQARREIVLSARRPDPDLPAVDPRLLSELKADESLVTILKQVEREIRSHRTTLIFVNTRPTAEGIAARLSRLAPDLPVAVHHGSLSRVVRQEAEEAFRGGRLRGLVATSSLELGIDIGEVDHVVQIGSPHQVGRLVQRVGRSGHRLEATIHGTVVAFDDDDLEEAAVLARRAMAFEVEPTRFRVRNRLAIAQQVVAALRAEGTIDRARLVRELGHAAPAEGLSHAEWDELFEYLERIGLARLDHGRVSPGRGTLKRFYATLSLIPEERTYRLRDIASRRPIGTLDERFVLTQILSQPEEIFLLHGQTWKVVEHRDDELLVEAVNEIGQEPRWAGEDLPVPFEVAQEIGRLRREGTYDAYPLSPVDRSRLEGRRQTALSEGAMSDDRRITITAHGRTVVFGACFGTRTNETLALAVATRLTERLGGRVDRAAVEPTWFILSLPIAADAATLHDALAIAPEELGGLVEKVVPSGLDYRWVFLTVARKFGLIPPSSDPRDLRSLEPLLDASHADPLGEEALEKTLFDRYDLDHAREVLERIHAGHLRVESTAPSSLSGEAIARLKWQVAADTPPPTLLRALKERLDREPLTLVCLRCGFTRSTTPERYRAEGGSVCRLCRGSLSAVLSPRRSAEIDRLRRYAQRKRRSETAGRSDEGPAGPRGRRRRTARGLAPETEALVRSAYTSAELVAHFGARALWALAARGVGPDTARRMLGRLYRSDDEFIAEIVRAERNYAMTRAFWD